MNPPPTGSSLRGINWGVDEQEALCCAATLGKGVLMVIPDFFFLLLVAMVISLVVARILHRKAGGRRGFLWLFFVIFLTVYAGGVWAKPYGTALSWTNWAPFVLSGVLAGLLLIVFAPHYPQLKRNEQLDRRETIEMLEKIEQEDEKAELAYISLNIFFWGIVLLLVFLIIGRYVGMPG